MKYLFIITGLLWCLLTASNKEPDAKDILSKSYNKCQSIKSGYYEMTHYMKNMTSKDTSAISFKCYFKKLPDDSIYSAAFHYQAYNKNGYSRDILYTGDDFINYSKKDSTGTIMSKAKWASKIDAFSHNYTFYSPLTETDSRPLPNDSMLLGNKYEFEYLGDEMIENTSYYHVRMTARPEYFETDRLEFLRIEYNYWISKKDYLPVQYSVAFDIIMNNDTMYQFQKSVLNKYELNTLKKDQLSSKSIPSYIKLQEYVPYKKPELLPVDAIAPEWSLNSLNDNIIKLDDYKGQLVLIDFFYKSCYPCLLAIPALQSLHEKYYDQGLRVVGIDPVDKKEDGLDEFLSKHGVTYTILLGNKELAKEYRVSGYPTLYLIDKKGKILFRQSGYGEGTEEKIEEIIKQHL